MRSDLSGHPAPRDRRDPSAFREGPRHHLILLRERQLTLRKTPRSLDTRRHDKQHDLAPLVAFTLGQFDLFVGVPSMNPEGVRHDAGAGLEGEELVAQPVKIAGQQKQREDGGVREIGREHVAFDEDRRVADALFDCRALRESHHVRVVLDAASPGAPLGRRDDVASVSGPRIDDEILGRDTGHVEHLVHDHRGRRHPYDVLARLAGDGLNWPPCWVACACAKEGQRTNNAKTSSDRVPDRRSFIMT